MVAYSGTIKSYNSSKGWGFIECAATERVYGKDVFVMRSALPGGSAEAGDPVSFTVTQGKVGPEATDVKVISSRPSSAEYASVVPPPSRSKDYNTSNSYVGVVKSYVEAKGWGFITSDATEQLFGKDIFFMKGAIESGAINKGDKVRFNVVAGLKGPEATDVRQVGSIGAVHQVSQVREVSHTPVVQNVVPVGWQTYYGVVKSFREDKGWGHIACDATHAMFMKDIFVMRSALRGQGVQPGDQVAFKLMSGIKGPEASDVRVLIPGSFSTDGTDGNLLTGAIKTYNPDKGWGFITSDELLANFGKDIFLHKREVADHIPSPGEEVQFMAIINKDGRPEATGVTFSVPKKVRPSSKGRPLVRSSPY